MNKTTRHPAIKGMLQTAFLGLGVFLSACSPVRPYAIAPVVKTKYPPTQTVGILRTPPERAFTVISRFVGSEPTSCPEGQDLCTLRTKAKAAGAHAVWIQKTDTYRYPGDWIMVEDRLTRLYPFTTTTYSGVFIRYTTP